MKVFKNPLFYLSLILVVVLGLWAANSARAFTEPNAAFPNGTTYAPLDTSNVPQVKGGSLVVNGFLGVNTTGNGHSFDVWGSLGVSGLGEFGSITNPNGVIGISGGTISLSSNVTANSSTKGNTTHQIFGPYNAGSGDLGALYISSGRSADNTRNDVILYNLGCTPDTPGGTDNNCNVPTFEVHADKTAISGDVNARTINGSVAVKVNGTNVLTAETDPKVGTLTKDKWCSTDGLVITCTQTSPVGATLSGSGTNNYIVKWAGTSGTTLGNSLIYDNGTQIGIGTASPGTKLDVSGHINAGGYLYTSDGSNGVVAARNGSLFVVSNGTGAVLINANGNYLYPGQAGGQGGTGGLAVYSGGASSVQQAQIGGTGNTWFNSGNVGIGITNPAGVLHIKGPDTQKWGTDLSLDATNLTSGSRWLLISTGGTDPSTGGASEGPGKFLIKDNTSGAGVRLTVDTSGNVGIGTTNPVGILDVSGGGNVYLKRGSIGGLVDIGGAGGLVGLNVEGDVSINTLNTGGGTYYTAGGQPDVDTGQSKDGATVGEFFANAQESWWPSPYTGANRMGCDSSFDKTDCGGGGQSAASAGLTKYDLNVLFVNKGGVVNGTNCSNQPSNYTASVYWCYNYNLLAQKYVSVATAGSSYGGNLSIKSGLAVNGNTTLSGTLGVTGATTLAGLSATNGTFSGTLGVTGATTLSGALTAAGATFSGNVGIGTMSPDTTYKLNVAGTAVSTGGWEVSSDVRLKTNITRLTDVLDKLQEINAVRFDWKNAPSKTQIGLIAQEVEKQFPELVSTGSDGYKSLAYDRFAAVLLEAVKEQQAQINDLQNQVTELRASLK